MVNLRLLLQKIKLRNLSSKSELLQERQFHLLVSLFGAIVFGAASYYSNLDLTTSVLYAFVGSVLTFVATNLLLYREDIATLQTDLTGLKPYVEFGNHERSLAHLAPILTSALYRVSVKMPEHGFAVTSADHSTYVALLEDALQRGKENYFMTLVAPLSPWWFLETSVNPEIDGGLTPYQKKRYLSLVKQATGFKQKTRLLIYDWAKPVDDGFGSDSSIPFQERFLNRADQIQTFLELAGANARRNGVKHYMFDSGKVEANGGIASLTKSNPQLARVIKSVTKEHVDFGLVDESLVIRRPPFNEVHIFPVTNDPGGIYRELRSTFEPDSEWWIPLDSNYLERCLRAGKLLSNS
ncbi:MAG: hypothetical protein HUJ31_14210 [Pseudomonadales bacterium]|nr:hypothetical protein [Pseudomonadales bacterium]